MQLKTHALTTNKEALAPFWTVYRHDRGKPLKTFDQIVVNLNEQFGGGFCPKAREVICNDRIGRKIRVKCNPDDTIEDLKKLIAAQSLGKRKVRKRSPQVWYSMGEDPHPKVVQRVQGPHHLGRLRDQRWYGLGP